MDKQLFAGLSNSSKTKKIFFAVFASILLIAAVISIAVRVNSKITNDTQSATSSTSDNIRASSAHTIVKSSCSVTLHPEICYATLSNVSDMTQKVKSIKDVIELALETTKETIQINHLVIKALAALPILTTREKIALRDCQEMVDDTIEELDEVVGFLKTYPTKKGNRRHVDDIISYMSTTITNQDTCIDGLSNERHLLELLIGIETTARKMCSNLLAMIKHMTDKDMPNQVKPNTRKLMNTNNEKWPQWLTAGDRRLLQAETVTPDVVVAADGSGDFTTISAAVEAAENKSLTRFVIGIAAGVYRENVYVDSHKWNLMLVGSGRNSTIITADRSVASGSTTFSSFTVAAVGRGFLARDITFENTAGPDGHQAVALRVGSDLSAFYQSDIKAYQDTLYVHSKRQFYVNCFISGTVDFIFGNAEVVLQDCDIQPRLPNPTQRNMVTAQGRSDPNQNTGIVIQKSRIGAASDLLQVQASVETYLGRPWREYSRTVIMQSEISEVIDPAGWFRWPGAEEERDATVYYGEYENTGVGADTSNRVTWPGYKVIVDVIEAQGFTLENFVDGGDWLGGTGFPFSLGL